MGQGLYLDPEGGDFVDGEHDGAGVGRGDDSCGVGRLVGWTGSGDEFPEEEFVEVSVSIF